MKSTSSISVQWYESALRTVFIQYTNSGILLEVGHIPMTSGTLRK